MRVIFGTGCTTAIRLLLRRTASAAGTLLEQILLANAATMPGALY